MKYLFENKEECYKLKLDINQVLDRLIDPYDTHIKENHLRKSLEAGIIYENEFIKVSKIKEN